MKRKREDDPQDTTKKRKLNEEITRKKKDPDVEKILIKKNSKDSMERPKPNFKKIKEKLKSDKESTEKKKR